MKPKKSIRERFHAWDADAFDLTGLAAGPMHPKKESAELDPVPKELHLPIERVERRELKAFRIVYPILAALFGAVMLAFLLVTVFDLPPFGSANNPTQNEVVERYVRDGLRETGAVNIVAGVILDYRAFDTLGESHVLFTALTAVLILLLGEGEYHQSTGVLSMQHDRIVITTAKVLVPIIVLFGVYVILNGHLGPGGGFSGGAIMGAGLILYCMTFGFEKTEKFFTEKTFKWISFTALAVYCFSKAYSFYTGANGLHSHIPLGTPGAILSSGLIFVLNICVGMVVTCTMYTFYAMFRKGEF